MTYGTQDLGFFSPGEDYRPSRADRRRDEQSRRKRRRRRLIVPLVALIVLALLGGAALYGGRLLTDRFNTGAEDYAGEGTGSVLVRVEPGDTATDIAATLVAKGVLKSEKPFREAAKKDSRSVGIQPGVYRLRKQMSGAAALLLILDPASRQRSKVTIPEGYTAANTLKLLADRTGIPPAQFQAAARNVKALELPAYARGRIEGFLFPSTYEFDPEASAAQILHTMVAEYRKRIDSSGLSARAASIGITPYEMITVASLVERETQRDDERPKVARVIYNRLAQDFYLGVDAAVLYGLGRTTGGLSAADLAKPTPYNNRLVKGLPPTPISNPGESSVRAALAPAAGPWLYYVLSSDRSGRHIFTDDADVFNTAKAKCRAAGLC